MYLYLGHIYLHINFRQPVAIFCVSVYVKYIKLRFRTVFEIRENIHCGGVIFQAGNPESMLKNSPSTVNISSYFEHCRTY